MIKDEQKNKQIPERKVFTDTLARWLSAGAFLSSATVGFLYYNSIQSFSALQNDVLQTTQTHEKKITDIQAQINSVEATTQNLKNLPPQIINKGLSEEGVLQKLEPLKKQFATEISAINQKYDKLLHQTSDNKHFKELLLASSALSIYDLVQSGAPIAYETEILKFLSQGDSSAESAVDKIFNYAKNEPDNKIFLIGQFNEIYAGLNDLITQNTENAPTIDDYEKQTWYTQIWIKFRKMFVRKKQDKTLLFEPNSDDVYKLVNSGNFMPALKKMYTEPKYVNINSPQLAAWQQKAKAYANFELSVKELVFHALAVIRLDEMQAKQEILSTGSK